MNFPNPQIWSFPILHQMNFPNPGIRWVLQSLNQFPQSSKEVFSNTGIKQISPILKRRAACRRSSWNSWHPNIEDILLACLEHIPILRIYGKKDSKTTFVWLDNGVQSLNFNALKGLLMVRWSNEDGQHSKVSILILFDLIWFDLIWFDLIDLILCNSPVWFDLVQLQQLALQQHFSSALLRIFCKRSLNLTDAWLGIGLLHLLIWTPLYLRLKSALEKLKWAPRWASWCTLINAMILVHFYECSRCTLLMVFSAL